MRSRLARRRRAVLGADRPATSPRCAWLSQTARRPLCRRHRRQSRVVCVGVLDGVHASRRTGFCHCRRNLGGNAHRQWRCVELCRWRFCFCFDSLRRRRRRRVSFRLCGADDVHAASRHVDCDARVVAAGPARVARAQSVGARGDVSRALGVCFLPA